MSMRGQNTRRWLSRLQDAAQAVGRNMTFMEVCGTHTTSAFRCGLHSLMPDNVALLSGPGCPVCVTAQQDIDLLIELAAEHDVILCTYGDMIRVPGERGSLENVRSRGADVRVVYSALDATRLAETTPNRQVVFAAVGFETTAPNTAVAVLQAQQKGITNFSVLTSHKRVIPAMSALLEGNEINLDGFLCPGHVSVVIGSNAYAPIVNDHRMSCVIAGFEDVQMVAGLTQLTELIRDGKTDLINEYPEAVTPAGNTVAQELLLKVYEPVTVHWRGIGDIPDSGLVLREAYHDYSAYHRFDLATRPGREPAGCRCGKVITGTVKPLDCGLFGTVCTPIHPIGPCMVSSEGTCQAWFKYNRDPQRSTPTPGTTPGPAPSVESEVLA